MTPAMLDQARKLQQEKGLTNVSWQPGDVYSLPFPQPQFSIVSSRFALPSFSGPAGRAQRDETSVQAGRPSCGGGHGAAPEKAAALNAAELLRDPSHARALTVDELRDLFEQAGLANPQ